MNTINDWIEQPCPTCSKPTEGWASMPSECRECRDQARADSEKALLEADYAKFKAFWQVVADDLNGKNGPVVWVNDWPSAARAKRKRIAKPKYCAHCKAQLATRKETP